MTRILFFFALAATRLSAQGNITTYAGGGGQFTGDGQPAIAAQFPRPGDVAVDSKGNVFFTSPPLHMVMQVTPDGALRIAAGNGLNAYSGDGSPARAASLRTPTSVKVDAAGNILISDTINVIRSIGSDGIIRTIAGTATCCNASGDGGPALKASFVATAAVADAAGNLYIVDSFNHQVRMVSAAGIISTIAGNGKNASAGDGGPATAASVFSPNGIAVDASGKIYVSERFGNRVRQFTVGGTITTVAGIGPGGYSGDGGPGTQAALSQPAGLALDRNGILYIADTANQRIRRLVPGGTITTVAGNGLSAFSGDGGSALTASLGSPKGVAVAADGSLFVADTDNDRIRKISPDGIISTIAGSGAFLGDGPVSTAARLDQPVDVTLDPSGNLFILTSDLRVRKVSPGGAISTYVGTGRSSGGSTGGLAIARALQNPISLKSDSSGNLYIADNAILKVAPDGSISTLVSSGGGGGLAIDPSGNVYSANGSTVVKVTPSGQTSTIAGTGQRGYSGDGGPATSATFGFQIRGIAVGPDGSIYVSDYENNRIRRIDGSGKIATFAGNGSSGVAGDGGPAISAAVGAPRGLVFDAKGNLFIAQDANVIRKIAPDGTISRYAATGRFGFSGDGGSALTSAIAFPQGIALDRDGNLYIADSSNDRIRLVQAGAGPFLLLSQKGLTFRVGSTPAAQSLTVVNSGQGTVNWAVSTSVASAGPNWLSATPASGSSPAGQAGPVITVKADPAGLAPGDYYGQVVVSAPGVPNSPQSVTVVLSVPAAGTAGSSSIQPSGLLFTATAGGIDPAPQNLTLSTTTAPGTKFGANVVFGDGRPWFTFQPSSGTVSPNAPLTLQVKPAVNGFAPGVYNAVITVAFDDATIQQVNLLLVVSLGSGTSKPGLAAAGCTPGRQLPLFTSIGPGFSATAGWPAPVEVRVSDDCGNPLVKGTVTASFSNSDPPLTLNSLLDGRWTGTWQVGNSGKVNVTVEAKDSSGAISGTAQVSGGLNSNANPPPVVASGGVLDAASYALGAQVAPGSLVSIFGQFLAQQESKAAALPLPITLGTTQVSIAGRAMPLLFTGANQVNAMIPFDLAINSTHQIVVRRGNTISIPEPVSLLSSRSGVFTKDLTGKGAAIVVKAATDGTQSIVAPGNPVSAYDAIIIYCDGLGGVDPQALAGSETPASPLSQTLDAVSVTIGGVSAPVFFAGLTPGFTGLYQVNAYVPTGVAPGDSVPLILRQAGRNSSTVSITVR